MISHIKSNLRQLLARPGAEICSVCQNPVRCVGALMIWLKALIASGEAGGLMNDMAKPTLLHYLWRCENCGRFDDCTYNTRMDRWLCATCALDSESRIGDYAWSSPHGQERTV
jgi:ribosomal protein L37E